MAKNLQYGRLRAVALQVVMWTIFGASLGLAAYIDHRRSGALDVQLGEPITEGRLIVRLPKGWDVQARSDPTTSDSATPGSAAPDSGSPRALDVLDYDRHGRLRRTLTIMQEQQAGRVRGPEYYLQSKVNLPADDEMAPPVEPFSFLGQDDAVLVAFKINTRALRRYVPDANLPEAGVYACVVRPDGLTVTVHVTGDGAYGPSSRQLVRLVTDNIKVAAGATTRKGG